MPGRTEPTGSLRKLWEDELVSGEPGYKAIFPGGRKAHFGAALVDGVRVPDLLLPNVKTRPRRTDGLELTSVEGSVSPVEKAAAYLSIKCRHPDFVPVFFRFVDEIVEGLEAGFATEAAVGAALETWFDFLRSPGELLSPERIVGLWAEVHFLRELLATHKDPMAVIDAWKGPDRDAWDFQLPGSAVVEVKATRKAGRAIVIHDETQLNPGGGIGWLLFNRIGDVHAGGAGESLAGIVDAILDSLKSQTLAPARKRFMSALSRAGYCLVAQDSYREPVLRIEEQLWFKVDDSFPVLRLSQIAAATRARISNLEYTFDLVGLVSHTRPAFSW